MGRSAAVRVACSKRKPHNRQAIGKDSSVRWFHIHLAQNLRQRGEFNEAAEVAKNALREAPHDIDFVAELIRALVGCGEPHAAREIFDDLCGKHQLPDKLQTELCKSIEDLEDSLTLYHVARDEASLPNAKIGVSYTVGTKTLSGIIVVRDLVSKPLTVSLYFHGIELLQIYALRDSLGMSAVHGIESCFRFTFPYSSIAESAFTKMRGALHKNGLLDFSVQVHGFDPPILRLSELDGKKLFTQLTTFALGSEYRASTDLQVLEAARFAALERLYKGSRSASSSKAGNEPRLVAFYSPHFHELGAGMPSSFGSAKSAWTKVGAAKPRFPGHDQPKTPRELGYYDSSRGSTLEEQAKLATEYGISGFCFIYEWRDGEPAVSGFIQTLVECDADIDLCICWDRHPTTSRGQQGSTKETHPAAFGLDDARCFLDSAAPLLKDPRYMTIAGAPLLVVRQVADLRDPVGHIQILRQYAMDAHNVQLHIAALIGPGIPADVLPVFESAIESPDDLLGSITPSERQCKDVSIIDYREMVEHALGRDEREFPIGLMRTAVVSWDTTPIQTDTVQICRGSSPRELHKWLSFLRTHASWSESAREPIVFLHAWNDWLHGAYLEPDVTHGLSKLDTLSRAWNIGKPSTQHALSMLAEILENATLEPNELKLAPLIARGAGN